MAENGGPDHDPEAGRKTGAAASSDEGLDRRRRDLDAALASRRVETLSGADEAKSREASGYGQAMRLSSEFIAGIVAGAGLGWLIDRVAGTSPWCMILFLLLGFCAGILNVLRSAGMVAESGLKTSDKQPPEKRN